MNHLVLANAYAAILKLMFLLALLVFFFLAPAKTDGIKKDAQAIITVTWDSGIDSDVDTWLLVPDGQMVFYKHLNDGLINLERDDLGMTNDYMVVNGQQIVNPLNQEIITFRGIVPGNYVLNVHLFKSGQTPDDSVKQGQPLGKPIHVTVIIQKVNPSVEVVFTKTIVLTSVLQEVHIARFNIEQDGTIDEFDDTNPISLLQQVLTAPTDVGVQPSQGEAN